MACAGFAWSYTTPRRPSEIPTGVPAQAKMLRWLQASQAAPAAGYCYPDLKADLSGAMSTCFARSGVTERHAPTLGLAAAVIKRLITKPYKG